MPNLKRGFALIELLIIIAIVAILCAIAVPVKAQDAPWYANPLSFAQHTSDAKGLTAAIYPSYAPDIVTDGKKDQFGFGAAILYPVMADTLGGHGFVGGRIDFLGSQFWAPSATLGIQGDVQVFGQNVRVMALGGTIFPLSGAGDKNGAVGGIAGINFYTTIYAWGKDDAHPDGRFKLGGFFGTEHWTIFSGIIYHGGLALTGSF